MYVFTNLIVIDTQMCCVRGAIVINHYRKKCNGGKMHSTILFRLCRVGRRCIHRNSVSFQHVLRHVHNILRLLSKRLHRNWTELVSISFFF